MAGRNAKRELFFDVFWHAGSNRAKMRHDLSLMTESDSAKRLKLWNFQQLTIFERRLMRDRP